MQWFAGEGCLENEKEDAKENQNFLFEDRGWCVALFEGVEYD